MKESSIVSIDPAGRLEVPEEIRREAGVEPGMQLKMTYRDGRIEIEPLPRRVRIVKKGHLAVAVPSEPSEPLTDQAVRAAQDSLRARSDD
jgi:bifunctional DNA-binding transcriptional regulator/antitoxin component of YhaV-PrlF toxin-antitoxin module